MKKLLKGNYRLNKSKKLKAKKEKKNPFEEFEAKVMERLGGSIAFVSTSKLLWEGEDEKPQ